MTARRMTGLGTYRWRNRNPDQPGYGETIEIDVDALPQTDLLPNVPLPNTYVSETGQFYRTVVPNFRFGTGDDGLEEGALYHSTYGYDWDAHDARADGNA